MDKVVAKCNAEENLDDQDARLKGDAIGDTLYSESWVLKTLLKVAQELPSYATTTGSNETCEDPIELDETLETDMCLLWDMTADKDVAFCIYNNEIIQLSKSVLEECRAPRLLEIIVGILANICCQQEIAEKITRDDELISLILSLLCNRDSQTVIQSVRLLETLLNNCKEAASLPIIPALWKDVSFILQNSLNEELLCGTSKLLDILVSHLDLEIDLTHFPLDDILRGMLECQIQLKKDYNGENIPNCISKAFDALTSSLYNWSRNISMRTLIDSLKDSVSPFVDDYLGDILRRLNGDSLNEDEMSSLILGAVQATTIYFIVVDTPDCGKILERSAQVGVKLNSTNQYACDYRDVVGDCFRKVIDSFDSEHVLNMLEPLDVAALGFLLKEAQKGIAAKLDELVTTARTMKSFNKVVDTFESLSAKDSH